MKNSRLALVGGTAICTLLITYLLSHISLFGVVATAMQEGPTKEEFQKLKDDVTRINKLEEDNLGKINEIDKRYGAETKRIDTKLIQSEFKFAGIGDIVASALTLEQFRKVRGDNDPAKPQWVLCNGADKEANYAYSASQYTKDSGRNNVPDLVGRYPRGLADGLNLLQTLDDELENHTHVVRRYKGVRIHILPNVEAPGGDNEVLWSYEDPGEPKIVAAEILEAGVSGGETRPKTTIVNFFIRIN